MIILKCSWADIKEFRRAYLTINLVYYGLVVVGMVFVAYVPEVQQALLESVAAAFDAGLLSIVAQAYTGGLILLAMALTFLVNLCLASVVWITLPSLVVPFSGLLTGLFRALVWGMLFSPTTPELRTAMIPHWLTLILEGQAYILVMLAAYIQGKSFLWPQTVSATHHREGYVAGLVRTLRVYLFVVLILGLSAIYEVVELVWIVPLLL